MKILLREIFFFSIWITGIPLLLRFFQQRKKATIVLFHDLNPDRAGYVFTYLQNNFKIISLSELVNGLKKDQEFPPYSLIITFDDGRKRNLQLVPYLKDKQIPITLFLSTSENRLDGKKYISRNQVDLLRSVFDIQSHTINHPHLPIVNEEDAIIEVNGGKAEIENILGEEVSYFAFPYGEYCDRDIQILKESTFKAALSVDPGYVTQKDSIYTLKRICLPDYPAKFELKVKATGFYDLIFRKSGYKI